MTAESAPIRLDKWLWAARLFKTRQLAIDSINGGKVHLNGQRTKPGKTIAPGDRITVTKEPFCWDLTVRATDRQRRAAVHASQLYEEQPDSQKVRLQLADTLREERRLGIPPDHKPSKKDRRLIHRFKRQDTLEGIS